jgi:hypothetical protein
MLILDWIAERRIHQAIERGELDQLPGAGRPLVLDDDRLVAEDLRVAYRILKNAGYVPPELQCMREIADLQRSIEDKPDTESRRRALTRLSLLRAHLELRRGARPTLDDSRYAERLLVRLERAAHD